MQSADKYVIRVIDGHGLNLTGPGITSYFQPFCGDWATSSPAQVFIQRDINTVMIWLETNHGKETPIDEESLEIHVSRAMAFSIQQSKEYRSFIQGSPDALAAITDLWNPNRKYSLAPYLYGITLRIEGCRYPNPELVKLIRSVSETLRTAIAGFDRESRKIPMDSAREMEPLASPCIISEKYANS